MEPTLHSLKARAAAFAAGALTVSMIPAGLAYGDLGAMLGLKTDVETSADVQADDASVNLDQSVHNDTSAAAKANHDEGSGHLGLMGSSTTHADTNATVDAGDHGSISVDGDVRNDTDASVDASADDDVSIDASGSSDTDADASVDASAHDVDASADASAHNDTDVDASADDDDVSVDGSSDTDASADASASHDDEEEQDSDHDEDGGLLDGLGLGIL